MSDFRPTVIVRLRKIDAALAEHRNCTARSLAADLGVSDRTILRDMDLLRDQLGAPIEWEPSTKTWFLSKPWKGLGSLNLNTAEALALIIAQQSFRRLNGSPIATALQAILDKIAQTAGEDVRHSWKSLAEAVHSAAPNSAAKREQEHFPTLVEAINQNRLVEICYTKPGDPASALRHIEPLALAELDQRWTVVARDPAAAGNGIRKFLLARIESCRPLAKTFNRPADFDVNSYLDGAIGLFTGDSAYKVEAEFSAYAAPYLRETPWHPSQTITPLPNGRIHATWQVNHLLDIQRKLLSWGEHATVLAPTELLQAFASIAQHFAKNYPPTPNA